MQENLETHNNNKMEENWVMHINIDHDAPSALIQYADCR